MEIKWVVNYIFMYELIHTKISTINVTKQYLLPSHSLCTLFLVLCLSKTDLSLRIRADMIADFVADVFCLWALSDSEKALPLHCSPFPTPAIFCPLICFTDFWRDGQGLSDRAEFLISGNLPHQEEKKYIYHGLRKKKSYGTNPSVSGFNSKHTGGRGPCAFSPSNHLIHI